MKLKHLAAIFAFTIFVAFAILYYTAFYEPRPQSQGTRVAIGIKDEKTLVLSWQNLPAGTSRIDVFRARLACENWSKWKTTAIQDPSQGSVEVKIYENLSSDYCLYFEAISRSGEALWSSTPLNQKIAYLGGNSPPPQGQPNGPGTPSQPPSPPPSGSSPATPTSTPQPQPTSTPPPLPPQPTSTPPGAGATSTPPQPTSTVPDIVHTENFWVEHVNQRIEIGWQNMPSGTNKIVVSRSTTSEGPWTKLFEQQGPFENKPYVIRLLDETINSPRYYKLEVLSSSGATLQTFGPLLLSALGS